MVSQERDQRRGSGVEEEDLPASSAEDRSALAEDEDDDNNDGGDSTLAAAGSRKSASRSQASSIHGSPQPKHLTRTQVQRIKGHQKDHNQQVSSTDEILHGLSLAPWPTDLIPHKKRPRTFEQVIQDNSPRDKDKLANELDELDEHNKRRKTGTGIEAETQLPFHPKRSQAGSSHRKSTARNSSSE